MQLTPLQTARGTAAMAGVFSSRAGSVLALEAAAADEAGRDGSPRCWELLLRRAGLRVRVEQAARPPAPALAPRAEGVAAETTAGLPRGRRASPAAAGEKLRLPAPVLSLAPSR